MTLRTTLGLALLLVSGCSGDTIRFNAGADEITVPITQVSPTRQILRNPDPAGFDDAIAQLEADAAADQTIVFADITDCLLLGATALPGPGQLLVDANVEDVPCAVETDYRLIFVIDTVGSNELGEWNYSAGATAEVNKTFSPSPFAE